jgi:hypothetical protein
MFRFVPLSFILLACAGIASAQTPTPSPSPTDPCADIKAQAARSDATLKDWPALARYRDANTKTTAPLKNEDRVVFMGDSITDLWDDPKYAGLHRSRH